MITEGTQIDQVNSTVTVKVADRELSGLQLQEIVAELTQHMRYDKAMYFVFDMSNVEFIASDCLGCLVTFLCDLEQLRGRVAPAHCHPNVAFLFKVTRLDTVFMLYEDLDEACTHIIHG